MERKVVFFDIDGTIKPYARPVPESTREAIHLLRECGHIPVVCTGRTRAAAVSNDWLETLELAGMVCAGGGHVIYQGETVFLRTLPPEQAARLGELLLDAGCVFALEGPDALYYAPVQEQTVRAQWEAIFGGALPLFPMEPERQPIQKAIAACAEGLRKKGYLPELEARYRLHWYDPGEHIVELIPHEYSKATGIAHLLARLGLTAADAFAFGDGPNDVEMLQYCGTSIVMGDGQACAKAAADYITGPCDGDGIYDACRHFGLI